MYNIIVVEDEPIELESLHRIISECVDNAVLHEASTGRKAIDLIDKLTQIDMMFVDINIPLPNGKEVIEYLKAKNRDTKVIVTTANDDFDLLRAMINLKVEDYLLKPVKKTTLVETIKKNLGCNDNDIAATRTLKKDLNKMLESCDYPLWHDFIFNHINQAFLDSHQELQTAKCAILTLLDTIHLYLESADDNYQVELDSLNMLSQKVHQSSLNKLIYSQLIFQLMKISQKLFTHAFKNMSNNMDFLRRAKFHIEHDILTNVTLDSIAEKSYVSSCYLSRAFKKHTGVGFSNYVTGRKIAIARSLLIFSELKINAIALELSWQDSNYFCRIFKKETGEAPSEYRRMQVDTL
ncbi:response regulator [Celerinatantimonas sp. MCCC 1A17872]|uniref:response regulator transcription factor n=1 Tax=Celerinatantimonas sp. MCCC 1A17872 TaxID=3177514 RepID=UPI0038C976FD